MLCMDCAGLRLPLSVIDEIVELTGPQGKHKLGYTYSDIRTRLLPEALAHAFPSRKISRDDLLEAVTRISPSPPTRTLGDAQ